MIINIKLKNYIWLNVLVLLSILLSSSDIDAMTPYNSYTYDSYGNQVLIPNLYEPEQIITGSQLGLFSFNSPEDMYIDEDGNIFLLDTGMNQVIILDKNYETIRLIDEFFLENLSSPLKQARGIYSKNNLLYIADTGNNRIICANWEGEILYEIFKPDSEFFSDTVEFIPVKLVLDRAGNLYVQATGIYQGLVVFDFNREFQGFFGSEMVTTTVQAIRDFFWKRFMTPEQKEAMANYVPPEIRNLAIMNNDFIFTITNSAYIPLTNIKIQMDSIRRVNPKGVDTLRSKMLDSARIAMEKDAAYLNFVSVSADNNGFITLIDNALGKIYQFDSEMNLITAFGGFGDQVGNFISPVAIHTYKDKIFVLDKIKNSITIFALTDFGKIVHEAVQLHNEGKYEDAEKPWREVLNFNTNYDLAYLGVGKALLNQGEYDEAMQYFRLGRDSYWYNEAYQEYRTQNIRKNIIYYIILAAGLFAAYSLFKKGILKRIKLFKLLERKKD